MTDPIKAALRELSSFAASMTPHDIGGPGFEPEMSDAELVNADLLLFAGKVDAVIHAYGEMCRSHGMIDDGDMLDFFTNVLTGALEGNATFAVERGTRKHIADIEDSFEDNRADHDYKIRQAEGV